MTKIFALLVTATALTTAIGLPAAQALRVSALATGPCSSTACTLAVDGTTPAAALILVSGGEDDGEKTPGKDHRKHHDDCDDDEEESDDDCTADTMRPAPAGTATPPANGLFGKGAPPVAVTN